MSNRIQSAGAGLLAAGSAARGAVRLGAAPAAGLARSRGLASRLHSPLPWAPALEEELPPNVLNDPRAYTC
eukprot:5431453-Pyramimonas_sp.AAC.1